MGNFPSLLFFGPSSRIRQLLAQNVANNNTDGRLYLSGKNLNDDGAVGLAEELLLMKNHSATVKFLCLAYNHIGDRGAVALADALEHPAARLQVLILHNNCIGPLGAAALARALRVNATLHTLVLKNNRVGPKGATTLIGALSSNDNNDNDNNNEPSARPVNTTLKILYLAHNRIGSAGCVALAAALPRLAALQGLDLKNNQIDVAAAQALARGLRETNNTCPLEWLDLGNNPLIGSAGTVALAEALGVNNKLQVLLQDNNNVGDDGASAMAEALAVNATLQTYKLTGNRIGNTGAMALARGLERNTTLKSLQLGSNLIGNSGALALAQALTRTTTPDGTNHNNNHNNTAIASSSSLEGLDLSDNRIGDAGSVALVEALRMNASLTYFSVNGNDIDATGAVADIEAVLGMDAADRFFQTVLWRLERGVDASIVIPESQTLASDCARQLGLALLEQQVHSANGAVVKELKLPLEEEWTSAEVYNNGSLTPLLRFIEHGESLSSLTYMLRKSENNMADDQRRRCSAVDLGVVETFFEAVGNRPTTASAIDFTLILDMQWWKDICRNNMQQVLEFVTQIKDYAFVKKLNVVFSQSDDDGDDEAFQQLFETLSMLVHLRELRLEMVAETLAGSWYSRQDAWQKAFRHNGSMQSVELVVVDNDGAATALELPDFLLWPIRRNRFMARQMAEGRSHGTENKANRQVMDAEGAGAMVPPLSCYPKLFHQSLQCPTSTGPSWMLRGLMALGDAACTTTTTNTSVETAPSNEDR